MTQDNSYIGSCYDEHHTLIKEIPLTVCGSGRHVVKTPANSLPVQTEAYQIEERSAEHSRLIARYINTGELILQRVI